METLTEVKKLKIPLFDSKTERIFCELEKTQKEFWNLDRECASFLYTLIQIHNSKNVLEIGTSNGYSSIWIAKALENTKGKLTTIEFWEKRQRIARNNIKICCPNTEFNPKIGSAVVVLEDLSDDIKKSKTEKFDFVFIDANKREYVKYFHLISKMTTDNAVILADNILSHYEKVNDYVQNLFNDKNWYSQILDMGAGMMLSVKQRKNIK